MIPSQIYVDVPSSVVKGEIMTSVDTMLKEYKLMWEA